MLDKLLKKIGLRQRSLADRVNRKVMSGYQPSEMAKKVVGKVSSKRFNQMMQEATNRYANTHHKQLF